MQRAWDQMVAAEPELAGELDPGQPTQLLEDARALVSGYYRLEDPTRFDPQCCEQRVEVELADGTLLRGYIDRIDVAATGGCGWSTTRLARRRRRAGVGGV